MALEPPSSILLMDPNGKSVTSISLIQYVFSGNYSFVFTGENVKWSITPSLPQGIEINDSSFILSGTCDELISSTQYNFTVFNQVGFSSILFNIEVIECNQPFYTIRSIQSTKEGHFIIKHNNIILEDTYFSSSIKDRKYCLPPSELTFTFTCLSSISQCVGFLSSTNNTIFIHLIVSVGQTITQSSEMTVTKPPVLRVDISQLILHSKQSFTLPFTITGSYSSIDITPSLPSTLTLNTYFNTLTGSFSTEGQYSFTLLVNNTIGTDSKELSFFINQCPSLLHGLFIKAGMSIGKVNYSITDMEGILYVNETVSDFLYSRFFCLQPGSYWITMTSQENNKPWESALILLDQHNHQLESFQKINSLETQKERFIIGDLIDSTSLFHYTLTTNPLSDWMKDEIDISSWKESQAPNWDTFTNEKKYAYFRKSFQIDNPLKYSQVFLGLTTNQIGSVYLNNEFIRFRDPAVSSMNESQVILPSTYLRKGLNQVSIQLTAGFNYYILFSMQVHLITTACLDSSMNGIAISNETISNPKHPVKNAFEDTSGWWEASQLPVSVSYRFGDDLYISPSHMYIGGDKKNEGRPIAFQVFGQSIEPVSNQTIYEDLIGTVDAKSFLYGINSERIDLHAHHLYNQIQIVFLQSSNHSFMRVRNIHFDSCQESQCKKKIGKPSIPVGSSLNKKCPLGSYGIKQVRCDRQDVIPTWKDDNTMCLPLFAKKNECYVDTAFNIKMIRLEKLSSIQKIFTSILTRQLIVKEKEISIPYAIEEVSDLTQLSLIIRFTVDEQLGKYLEKTTNLYLNQLVDELKKSLKEMESTVDIIVTAKPTVHFPFPWTTIIVIVIVIVSIICVFLLGIISMYVYSRSSKNENRKQLKKKRTNIDQTALLDEVI